MRFWLIYCLMSILLIGVLAAALRQWDGRNSIGPAILLGLVSVEVTFGNLVIHEVLTHGAEVPKDLERFLNDE